MKSSSKHIIFRIVLAYFILGAIWIAASDAVMFALFPNPQTAQTISIYKGWLYVIITALLLAGLLYKELRELNHTHQRLEASERRFRLLYQDAPIAFHSLGSDGAILQVNRMWCQLLGYCEDEVTGRMFAEILAPASRERWQQTFDELVRGGRDGFDMELELKTATGPIILTAVSGRAVAEPDGGLLNYYCTFQDVTEQRQLEIETRQKSEEYRQIIDTVPARIYHLNADRTILRVNQAASLALRTAPAELIGKPVAELFPQYTEIVEQNFQQILDTGRSFLGETHRILDLDGRPMWITVDRIPFPGNNGRPAGVVLFVNEITDHVRREQDLEQLVDLASKLRGVSSREVISQVVLQSVMECMHVDATHLALRTQPDADLHILAAKGIWAETSVGRKISNPQSLCSRVVVSGQGLLNQSATAADWFDAAFPSQDLRAAGAVPLIAEQHVLGAIWTGSSRPIPEEDFRLLYAIADMAAAALQRSIHNEMTQLRLRRVSALHYIDMAISSSFDWHMTLNVLLGQAVNMLGVDAAAILTLNPESLMLEYVAGTGFTSGEIEKTRLRLGESQAGFVALKREIRYIPDLHQLDDTKISRFALAGEDFISYCAAPLVGKGQVKGVLELFHRTHFSPDAEWMDFLEMLAAQAAIAIDNSELFETLQQSISELHQSYDALILGWSRGLELRDAESQGHTNRLVDYTLRLARRLRVPENQMLNLRRGVLLHDIGKIGIPDKILLKPGPLSEDEWNIMRQHPVFAYDLLSPIPGLAPVLELPYSHHERWDGSGYPRGLKGEEIPLSARLFAVVDIWDALSHDRPYRAAWNPVQVVDYLRSEAGITLDPRAVEEFIAILHEDGLISSGSRQAVQAAD